MMDSREEGEPLVQHMTLPDPWNGQGLTAGSRRSSGRTARSSQQLDPQAQYEARGCSPPTSETHLPIACFSPPGVPSCQRQDCVSSLCALGPAAVATSAPAPSEAFARWLVSLERIAEERLLQEARRRFCSWDSEASLDDFRRWIATAARVADEWTLQTMRCEQVRVWLLCLNRLRRTSAAATAASQVGPAPAPFLVPTCPATTSVALPVEVKECVYHYLGGRHVWGPITAKRARAVAEAALRQLRRCEGVLRGSALSALVARYVHPMVVQAAEAGHMQCATEIPTDDVALQALFEVSAESGHDVGAALAAHLAIDGFEVVSKYHDPEYGLWRGFWVDKCSRVQLTLWW
eukprot:TRINITY_DN26021_c0_g1_i1.p1 TRINITY_DN26021_c0_g1~~TRINITY_DN26021_c0_g1_i1.p1  ORF type:complete len:349 (-),score=55.85 TRINITY_DN26021_c0_g1_i1:24-1070(-)